MISLKSRLQSYHTQHKVKWEIIEQDYALSWILAGVTLVLDLDKNLAFKGGTCLRKCYFGDYRFSQDIDFTVTTNHKDMEHHLEKRLQEACTIAQSLVQDRGENFRVYMKKYQEKNPHPEGQQAYLISIQFPWQREPLTTVYAEVSFQEEVMLPTIKRNIIHPYEDIFPYSISTYDINEIVAEKIRALLQFSKKLHERGWGRSRIRDYYDIWRILSSYNNEIDHLVLPEITRRKCQNKNILFQNVDQIFNKKLMTHVTEEWNMWLQDLVQHLPDREVVLDDLKQQLNIIFRNS